MALPGTAGPRDDGAPASASTSALSTLENATYASTSPRPMANSASKRLAGAERAALGAPVRAPGAGAHARRSSSTQKTTWADEAAPSETK